MNSLGDVKKIIEFVNSEITYGTYLVIFKGEQKVFIRNGDSVGVVSFYLDRPASQCVSEIRNDVKQEFFKVLEAQND